MARVWIVLSLGLLWPGACLAQKLRLPHVVSNLSSASQWEGFCGPEGQHIELPPGFQVRFLERGTVQVIGDRGLLGPMVPYLLVQPFIGIPGESASVRLRRVVLPQLRAQPSFMLERFVVPGPTNAALRARYAIGDVPRQALALASMQGRAGMCFVISAPFQGFEQVRNTLTRVAMSLRYGVPRERVDPLAELAFTTWLDPVEGAFSLEVPLGWEVQGGLTRRGPLDLTPHASLTAPEGRVRVFFNDRRNRFFLEPEPRLVAAGFHEGRWFSPAAGLRLHVVRYLPGADYLTSFLWSSDHEASWELLEQRELADLVSALPPDQTSIETHAGSVLFAAPSGREPMRGFFLAATRRWAGADGSRTWTPLGALGWHALPGQEELADQVLERLARSFRFDPAWAEGEGGLGQNGALAFAATLREMAKTLAQSFAVRERTFTQRLGVAVGPGHELDPATGDLFLPARGHNYYWLHVPSLAEGRQAPDVDLTPLADL